MFQINMRSGVIVKVEVYTWGLNIFAQAPLDHFDRSVGLCRTIDHHSNDRDVNKSFTGEHFIDYYR